MECSVRLGRIARQCSGSRAYSERRIDCKWNENDSGDFVSVPSDISGWFWGGLHESHRLILAWNSSSVRCATSRNATRSGAVHSLGSCAFALSTPANSLRPTPFVITLTASYSAIHHRIFVLQRNHRQCSHRQTAWRHVSNGKIRRKYKVDNCFYGEMFISCVDESQ